MHRSIAIPFLCVLMLCIGLRLQLADAQALHRDITAVKNVTGYCCPGGDSWADSYSVGSECYCDTTFDHDIGPVRVPEAGNLTVQEICTLLGPGPGKSGRPLYNDVQCGWGPANSAADETDCPGRVDIGAQGCGQLGPKWNLTRIGVRPTAPVTDTVTSTVTATVPPPTTQLVTTSVPMSVRPTLGPVASSSPSTSPWGLLAILFLTGTFFI